MGYISPFKMASRVDLQLPLEPIMDICSPYILGNQYKHHTQRNSCSSRDIIVVSHPELLHDLDVAFVASDIMSIFHIF